jgi:hypothetical protein
MATVTKGRTFVSGEVVTPTKLNTLVDSATVTQIVDADVSATAGIVDTKLATISTAGKVSGNAITSGTISGSTAINTTGTISSGTITANLTGAVTGNASTATALQTARTIAISGDVTGTATPFNGTAAITIASAITADSIVNADINSAAAIADTKLATISSSNKVSNSATTATSANTASAIVARDASGNFSAGTITASLSGNATTATTANAIADGVVSTPAKIANGIVTAAKLGTAEQARIAKCWVNFNGTGTPAIRSSYNVSSVTKSSAGAYRVNFSSAIAVGYSVSGIASNDAANTCWLELNEIVSAGGAPTTTGVGVRAVALVNQYAVAQDSANVSVTIFGN